MSLYSALFSSVSALSAQSQSMAMIARNNFLSGLKVRDEGARTC